MSIHFRSILILLATAMFWGVNLNAQSQNAPSSIAHSTQAYLGLWKTIDDKTQKPRSLIRVAIEDGQLTARVEKVFPLPGEPKEPICIECSGELKNTKVIGLNILKDMIFSKDHWKGGEILDPDNGKFYDAKIWLEEGQLKVRGYIGFFFRTQTWQRTEPQLKLLE